MTAMAAQAALSRRGVAVLIVPVDVSHAAAPDEPGFATHRAKPVIRPGDAELDRIAAALDAGNRVAIYGGSGCAEAHDEVVALAERLQAPVAHTSRAKDFLAHHNPYDVGMTGVFGAKGGYYALTECDTLLLLGCDFAWRQFYPQRATIIQIDSDARILDVGIPSTLPRSATPRRHSRRCCSKSQRMPTAAFWRQRWKKTRPARRSRRTRLRAAVPSIRDISSKRSRDTPRRMLSTRPTAAHRWCGACAMCRRQARTAPS
jgi:thiamine pyrophosphate-dependent acetolactate synthase large subunit-like protein